MWQKREYFMPYKKSELIKYQIEKSKLAYLEIDTCLENNLLHLAVNRVYYALFYSAKALALLKGFPTKNHKQLQSWFNREFVKNNIFPVEFLKIYAIVYERKQKGSFDDLATFTKEEVENDYKNIKKVNEKIWEYININLVE